MKVRTTAEAGAPVTPLIPDRLEHAGIAPHPGERPLHELAPLGQDDDRIAQLGDEIHVVLDEDEGPALRVEVADARDQRFHESRIHPGAGLVQQDDRRVAHEDARQLEELFLASRERLGGIVSQGRQVHELEDLPRRAGSASASWR